MPASEFDEFCRSAFAFLESHGTRYLITASLPFEETAYDRASIHELFGIRLPFPSPAPRT